MAASSWDFNGHSSLRLIHMVRFYSVSGGAVVCQTVSLGPTKSSHNTGNLCKIASKGQLVELSIPRFHVAKSETES